MFPHKYDEKICDRFLIKHFLFDQFSNCKTVYQHDCSDLLDLTEINSFSNEVPITSSLGLN